MAKLKRLEFEEDETVTQMISMHGRDKNILIKKAGENGRSLSNEIMYRVRQSLKQEGLVQQ